MGEKASVVWYSRMDIQVCLCLKATQEHLSFMNTLTLKSLGKAIFQLIVILTPIFMNCSSHGSAIPAEFLIFCAGSPQTKHDSLSPVFNCAKVEGVLVQKNGQP